MRPSRTDVPFMSLDGRPHRREIVDHEHRLILDALTRRDPVDAERYLAGHIRRTRIELAAHPEVFGPPAALAPPESTRTDATNRAARATPASVGGSQSESAGRLSVGAIGRNPATTQAPRNPPTASGCLGVTDAVRVNRLRGADFSWRMVTIGMWMWGKPVLEVLV
jgi:hypothetical protein